MVSWKRRKAPNKQRIISIQGEEEEEKELTLLRASLCRRFLLAGALLPGLVIVDSFQEVTKWECKGIDCPLGPLYFLYL